MARSSIRASERKPGMALILLGAMGLIIGSVTGHPTITGLCLAVTGISLSVLRSITVLRWWNNLPWLPLPR